MPLFKPSPKSPQDLVKNLRDALQVLNITESGGKKSAKVTACLHCIQTWLTSLCMATGGRRGREDPGIHEEHVVWNRDTGTTDRTDGTVGPGVLQS